MPDTIIHDPLGLNSGIKVTNVRSVLDREGDRIMITGRMTSDRIIGIDIEPELQCDVFNQKDQVCLSACSVHQGVFAVTRKVTFSIQVEEVSRYMKWDDIERISLYVIFRKPG